VDAEQVECEVRRCTAPLSSRGSIPARELEERLQKVMDEYAGGISCGYGYAEGELEIARVQLQRLEQALVDLHAGTPFELMQCHDVIDRVTVARTLVEHMLHRKETRWHAYQERLDHPKRDDARWMVFVNSVRDADGSIRMIEHPVQRAKIDVQLPQLADGAVIRGRRRTREE
jgi:adenylylsulfate reductase subunit A